MNPSATHSAERNLETDDALRTLLEPVPGAEPCGVSIRQESLFTEIRLAREEDDPALPMGQWERPLKRADWARIEQRCTDALVCRSKDLQLAAWLAEAWTRQAAGLCGLARGLRLLRELSVRYWPGLYPALDPGDAESGHEDRIVPFDWLDGTLARTVRVFLCLFPLAERKPGRVSLADWERLTATELSAAGEPGERGAPGVAPGEPPLTREDILADIAAHHPAHAPVMRQQVGQARDELAALEEVLQDHLGPQAPRLRQLRAALEAMDRVLSQVPPPRPVPDAGGARSDPAPEAVPEEDLPPPGGGPAEPGAVAQELPIAPTASVGSWRNREEAYRTLEALARYLATIEPHSPTPYLVNRAVRWGRLPLPELMAEIVQEEGDLNRMVQLLGLGR